MKGISKHTTPVMKQDEWLTPPHLVNSLGNFDLDPCSPISRPWDTADKHFTVLDNGLIKEWHGRVWLNPPYGKYTSDWMNKMAMHGNGIALIFARTETSTWFNYVWPVAHSILFIKGRLTFCNSQGLPASSNSGAPSALIAYSESDSEIIRHSGINGKQVFL